MGETADCLLLLLILPLSYVWLWFSVGDVLTLSWLLGYSSKLETAHRYLTKIQCGKNSQRELNLKMLLNWDYLGHPVVKNLPSNAGDLGLIPDW